MRSDGQGRGSLFPRDLVRASFATEQAVYGVILVSGIVAVSGRHGATSAQVLLSVVVTVVVFWAAHVYAGTVARHGLGETDVVGLRAAFRASLRTSWGLLLSALIPCTTLVIGSTRAIPDDVAIWTALGTGVVVLGALGYIAFARRGAPWPIRVLGSVTTAMFGVVMMIAKAFIH